MFYYKIAAVNNNKNRRRKKKMNRIDILKEEFLWLRRDICDIKDAKKINFVALLATYGTLVFSAYLISVTIRLLRGY